jgi:hypothetical protein
MADVVVAAASWPHGMRCSRIASRAFLSPVSRSTIRSSRSHASRAGSAPRTTTASWIVSPDRFLVSPIAMRIRLEKLGLLLREVPHQRLLTSGA